jgi:beta-galactosidase
MTRFNVCYLTALVTLLVCLRVQCNWITYDDLKGKPFNVTYDHRAIKINGQRVMLLSGDVHYTRSSPAMWPTIMKMAREHGLNTLQVYTFWNHHERKQGTYDFSGRGDLLRFLELAKQGGLFVSLRFGPYVCAEWRYGGLPLWLQKIPGMAPRTYNQPFMREMKRYVTDIAKMVEPYLAKNGGPIILAQIENEYRGSVEYVNWCGALADSLHLEIPWFMSNGMSANNTINTCNSCNCIDDKWVENHKRDHKDQPLMWTEISGRFQVWGLAKGIRPPEYIAHTMTQWIAYGGSFTNHYMWYGGNNYGTDAGASVTTQYSDDSNVHSDLTPNEPKFSQVRRLNNILAKYANVILQQDSPTPKRVPYWNQDHWDFDDNHLSFGFNNDNLVFLVSSSIVQSKIQFCNKNLTLSPLSSLILSSCQVIFNSSDFSGIVVPTPSYTKIAGPFNWKVWNEPIGVTEPVIAGLKIPITWSQTPLEQVSVTGEISRRLWYRQNITVGHDGQVTLKISGRRANSYMVFVDKVLVGTSTDTAHYYGVFNVSVSFDIKRGTHLLEVLSVSLGTYNAVAIGKFDAKGITGDVLLDNMNITGGKWAHQNGSVGEYIQVWSEQGSSIVEWTDNWKSALKKPLVWFQAKFDLNTVFRSDVYEPVMLNILGMVRGTAYLNGFDLGLYWNLAGQCRPMSCTVNDPKSCDKPTQMLYHIPPELLKAKDNVLTLLEELGAEQPEQVTIVKKNVV